MGIAKGESPLVEAVDSSNFNEKVLNSNVPVLVDFFQLHCLPCKKVAPVLEEASEIIGDKGRIVSVQLEKSPDIVIEYDVFSFPTMILFNNGEATKRIVGPRPLEAILELF